MASPSVFPELRAFGGWVRCARAWRWMFLGLYVGAAADLAMFLLDLSGKVDFTLLQLATCLAVAAGLGAVMGFAAPLSGVALTKSIDRRANLADRLASAMGQAEGAFVRDLEADARERLRGLQPWRVFPLRFGRMHVGAILCAAMPLGMFQLNASHVLLSPQDRKDRAELKQNAKKIERIVEPFNKPENKKELTADEKSLQRELEKMQRDLEHGKLDKAAAKQKAEQISQLAEQLMRERVQKSLQSLDSAKAALDRYKKSQIQALDPSLNGLEGQQLDDKLSELEAQAQTAPQEMDRVSKQMADLQKRLANSHLSAKQRADMERQLAVLRKQMQQLKLSQAVKDMMSRMHNDPLFKEVLDAMRKLARNANAMQAGQRPTMTPEEMEELRQILEELARQLKSDAAMKAYLQHLLEALKHARLAQCNGLGIGLLGLGIPGYGASDDQFPSGAPLNFNDKESAGAGKTSSVGVRGDRREDAVAPSMYMEERGPAKLTGPSSIPMLKNVPASRRKAEEAIDKQQIPKEHQERVKRYFQALEGK